MSLSQTVTSYPNHTVVEFNGKQKCFGTDADAALDMVKSVMSNGYGCAVTVYRRVFWNVSVELSGFVGGDHCPVCDR